MFGLEFFRINNTESTRVDSFVSAVVCAESEAQALAIFLASEYAQTAIRVPGALDTRYLEVEHIAAQPGIVLIHDV